MAPSALILLDLQKGVLPRLEADMPSYLSRVAAAADAARAAGVPVIHVRTCFRPGHPEVSRANASFSRITSLGGFVEGDPAVDFADAVAPQGADIVVTKRRVSAFAGSDLEVVLRAQRTQNLVLAGVATSGAVLSTVRQAADLDFGITVLDDLCLDRDEQVHRVLVEKLFPKQAQVVTAEEWIQDLRR
ncbi:MAG: cysteine hydrolase [Terriglobus roseus]|nr:cysteine hydrolase [Terriglobus roseus]